MADNKKYYYLKLKEDFFESDEAVVLESMADGYIYTNILLKLYLRSLKNNGLLMFNNLIPYNAQMLATITRHPIGVVEKAVKIFRDLQLIDILDNGAIYMANIENFVGKSSTNADRMRKYRTGITNVTTNEQQMLNECAPEIEIEKEIELEKEINIDIESEVELKQPAPPEFNIYAYYQQRIGVMDGYQVEKLKGYVESDGMELELVKRAIDRGADNSKRNFGYINAILKNWAQDGIKTIVQQDEEQRRFKEKSQKPESNVPEWATEEYRTEATPEELKQLEALRKRMTGEG